MKNEWIIFCSVLILNSQLSTLNCSAQAELKRERTFTETGLYGYMNGGADQFLEYGVQKLTVREIAYQGEEYSVEVYEMPTPEDAYGIYSLHTFRCQRADTLGGIDCLSPYQLQGVSGNQYISVVFPSGSDKAARGADEVMRLYAGMPSDVRPAIPPAVDVKPPYSGRLKYLRGPLSVSAASFDLAGRLEGVDYTGVWFVSEKGSNEYRAWALTGDSLLYLTGKEKEEEGDDFGGFGF